MESLFNHQTIDEFLLDIKRNGYEDVIIKTDNDRDFYRYIFKVYDEYLATIDEDSLGKVSLFCTHKGLLKVVDILKYMGGLDYKSKVKQIKGIEVKTIL